MPPRPAPFHRLLNWILAKIPLASASPEPICRSPNPSPNEMLLDACQSSDSAQALRLGLLALRLGANPRAGLGSREAFAQAFSHGNAELGRAILLSSGSAFSSDAFGLLPLERFLADEDIPEAFKPSAVDALIGAGSDPHGDPKRRPPLAIALDMGLDDCAHALASALGLDASSLVPSMDIPLGAAALASGASRCAQGAFERCASHPAGPEWLSQNAMALCLCCVGSSNHGAMGWRARRLVDIPMRWLSSCSEPLLPHHAESAMAWLEALPWTAKGGRAAAFDGDPAFEALLWAGSSSPPLGAAASLAALGAPPPCIAAGMSACESRMLLLASGQADDLASSGSKRL